MIFMHTYRDILIHTHKGINKHRPIMVSASRDMRINCMHVMCELKSLQVGVTILN